MSQNQSPRKLLIEINDEIEQKVLSMILNDPNALVQVISILKPDDFLNQTNRLIYREIINQFEVNGSFDITILTNSLKAKEDVLNDDANTTIFRIINLYNNSADLELYLKLMKQHSIANKLYDFGYKLSDQQFDFDNFSDNLWTLQKNFSDIINSFNHTDLMTSEQLGGNYAKLLENIKTHNNQITGITSGFSDIDEFTNGFQEGDLIILAARPSIGKTALSLNFLINAAKHCDANECVAMFSLEMSSNQLMERIVSFETGINSRLLRSGGWSREDQLLIDDCIDKIGRLPIIIDDSSNSNILDIQSKLKKIASTKKIRLVVIDYLQLVQGSSKIGVNRQQEVAQISRAFKSLARDLQTPIIAVAQLSRKIEERKGPDKKPILSDLRESGSIEQDADIVAFIDYNRSEVDNMASNDVVKKYESIVIVDFIIAKHRNGATGELKLAFDKSCGRYSSYKSY